MSAEPFKEMAARIEHNAATEFAGAYVIVSPDGEAKEVLILNRKADAAQFWSLLKVTCDIALAELAQQQAGQFAPRR